MHLAGEEPNSANGMPRDLANKLQVSLKWRVLVAERNLRNTSSDRRASGPPRGEGSLM